MKVRIGYGLGTQTMGGGAAQFTKMIDELERLRFDSLWLSERVTGAAPDPLAGLAFAAGRTTRIKFGTSVLVLPGRPPALLAKELATIDVLSGGRLLPAFGLGVADPREQQAFGVERHERAALFDEAIELVRAFWTGAPVTHAGRFRYDALAILPRPVQSPPDIWMGGRAPSELRRVGRLSDGWLPSFVTPAEAAAGGEVVRDAAAAADRSIDAEHFGALIPYSLSAVPARFVEGLRTRRPDVDPGSIIPAGVSALQDLIAAFVEVGFSKFVLIPVGEPPDWTAELEELASSVLPLEAKLSS
jgi:probable F420-dependent oxidoreductase